MNSIAGCDSTQFGRAACEKYLHLGNFIWINRGWFYECKISPVNSFFISLLHRMRVKLHNHSVAVEDVVTDNCQKQNIILSDVSLDIWMEEKFKYCSSRFPAVPRLPWEITSRCCNRRSSCIYGSHPCFSALGSEKCVDKIRLSAFKNNGKTDGDFFRFHVFKNSMISDN